MPRKNPAAYRRLNAKPKAGKPKKPHLLWEVRVAHSKNLKAVQQGLTDDGWRVHTTVVDPDASPSERFIVSAYLSQWGTPADTDESEASEVESGS